MKQNDKKIMYPNTQTKASKDETVVGYNGHGSKECHILFRFVQVMHCKGMARNKDPLYCAISIVI